MSIFSDFRGFRGEFCRFNMIPGMYEYNTVPSDQFILSIHSDTGGCIYQSGKPVYTQILGAVSTSQVNQYTLRYWGLYLPVR